MTKKILLASILAEFSFSAAASQVTLYGVIDGGIAVSKAAKKSATVEMSNDFSYGTRWGIRGVEDLGNGYKVGFVLEQAFKTDNGNAGVATKAFNRESLLFVEGGFGKVAFGRFGALGSNVGSFNMLRGWSLMPLYGMANWNKWNLGTNRLDNSVAYFSPVCNGFKLGLMYSNGVSTDDGTLKWSKNTHYYGAGLGYAKGALDSSVIFEVYDDKGGVISNGDVTNMGVDVGDRLMTITAGAAYNFGTFKLLGIYEYISGQGHYDTNLFGLSADIPLAGGSFKPGVKFGFRNYDQKQASLGDNDDGRVWFAGAAYMYPLSKRTHLYGFGGYSQGYKAFKDDYSAYQDVNYNGWQLAVGMVHKF